MQNSLNDIQKRRLLNAVLTVVVLFALFLLFQTLNTIKSYRYIGHDIQTTNVVSVTGTGEVTAVPDTGMFSFSVTESAPAQKDALAMATKKVNTILDAVTGMGVDKKDIQTTGYNVYPKYEYQGGYCTGGYCPQGKQTLTGYEVSQTMSVKVRTTADAGAILAKVTELGAENVSGLSFVIDDIDAVNAQARDKAIANAKDKAAKLSKSLGVSLDKIVNFYENGNQPPVMYASAGMKAMDSQAVPATPEIPVGENKITSSVTITYEIQ